MKLAKCLIFKISNRKFAIRTSIVSNIIDKPKIINIPSLAPYQKAMFSYEGALIPLLDIKRNLGLAQDMENTSYSKILIVEIKNNNKIELTGIEIDEVIEVIKLDDILSYPFYNSSGKQNNNFRESVLIHKGEPVIFLNTSKFLSNSYYELYLDKPSIVLSN